MRYEIVLTGVLVMIAAHIFDFVPKNKSVSSLVNTGIKQISFVLLLLLKYLSKVEKRKIENWPKVILRYENTGLVFQ